MVSKPRWPRVVIVGAGFAGLTACPALARAPVEVFLIDRNNFHTFLPLLYQVSAAELEPEDIAYPARSVVRNLPHARFLLSTVQAVDLDAKVVVADGREVPYDYLILAAGSVTHFFDVPGASEYALPLKTLEEGAVLRNHIFCRFERAEHETDPDSVRSLLTFVIVGGGPTGVEFAGALAELICGPLAKDFPWLDIGKARLVLVEARNTLLTGMPQHLGDYVAARLGKMGVEVLLNSTVAAVTSEAVLLKDGTHIPTQTVVWTAGVRGSPVPILKGTSVNQRGLVTILPTLQVPGHLQAYVIGDLAFLQQDGHPLPMIAPVAIQQGIATARNLERQISGKEPLPFRYRDKGMMVTTGRNSGAASLGNRNFTGFVAWFLWLAVHLYYLIGFRNRLLVLSAWAWNYLLFDRPVRLILPLGDLPCSGPLKAPRPPL